MTIEESLSIDKNLLKTYILRNPEILYIYPKDDKYYFFKKKNDTYTLQGYFSKDHEDEKEFNELYKPITI